MFFIQAYEGGEDLNKEYQPGSLTDPRKRVEVPPLFTNEKSLEELTDEIEIKEGPSQGEIMRNIHLHEKSYYFNNDKPTEESKPLPVVDTVTGFHYARKMHMDFLLHHPLPDATPTKHTRKQPKYQKDQGQDLDIKPYSLGWKGSSNNIHTERPLTSGGMGINTNHNFEHILSIRPATSGRDPDISSRNATAMDLAIRWDYRTKNPRDEPKRPKHIDGSNGSMAPAVFSMVQSPKQNFMPETGRSNALFSYNAQPEDTECDRVIPCFEKDMAKYRRKESCDVPKCEKHSHYEKPRSPSVDHNLKTRESKQQPEEKKSARTQSEKRIKSGSCDGVHGCGTSDGQSSRSSRHSTRKSENHKPLKNAWVDISHTKYDSKENSSANLAAKYKQDEKIQRNQRILDELNNNNASPIETIKKNQTCQSSSKSSKISSEKSRDSVLSRQEYPKLTVKNEKNLRSCLACHDHNTNHDKNQFGNEAKKPEYKMAFKAGKPNSTGSLDSKDIDNSSSNTNSKNSFKIPKMRDPYSKKTYAIPTLAPPFSRWRDTTGYPEHWRLASVYQHAYKHPEARRHPLLPAVYR